MLFFRVHWPSFFLTLSKPERMPTRNYTLFIPSNFKGGFSFSQSISSFVNIAIHTTTVHRNRLSRQTPLRSVWSAHHGSIYRIIDWIPRPLQKRLPVSDNNRHLSLEPLTVQLARQLAPHAQKFPKDNHTDGNRSAHELTDNWQHFKGYWLCIVQLLHTCRQPLPLLPLLLSSARFRCHSVMALDS